MSEEEANVENQEEQVPPEPKNILKAEQIAAGLSQVSKIHGKLKCPNKEYVIDGSSYAYVNLNLEEKELQELGDQLRLYQHLRFLNLSKNQLQDLSEVTYLPYLLTLNTSENQINDITFFRNSPNSLQYLQLVNLSKNKLQELTAIQQPRITRLILNENEIASAAQFQPGQSLKILELRKNKLTNCAGLSNIGSLEELFLAENEISDISGLFGLYSLKRLHLRNNKITSLDDLPNDLTSLESINIRENQVASLNLTGLTRAPRLNKLSMQANPIVEEKGEDFKKEVLIFMLGKLRYSTKQISLCSLNKIGKDEITADDIKDAENERNERIKVAEEARLEKERLAAEGGGAEEQPPAEDE
ncbi:leucine-rich repeat-containing protein 23 [Stylonychia lemnae]|uniref:Leucine-rich repeat-containing protein 23 n=1 Tax=Stylonychia lemnae TaxID=5949 RepID=A0A078A5M5_STYLE|nr:leucine-rich repeat-containing protein 23 [Stylonychia lemnae]|eukprot:CDW77484.1 leucine-rich repeat-containing protein 23 [Stylonychia lemnae]